ncbi:MAG: hypothetical protein E4G91_04600 [Candidatus Zixiibacteriota bacterium]|nr:MAG: hypothetical protein E4G91_04600 [candidate division Zixibacteria bacterium]
MLRFVTLIASAVVILCTSLAGRIIQVPSQFTSIQVAINNANNGDTVLVAQGLYYENLNFRGKKIMVASRFLIDQSVSTIRSTIIDGSSPIYPDSASVVLFASGEDTSTVLIGFTLTKGIGTLVPGSFLGGGILVTGQSSPTIKYNIISQNSAITGGGMAVYGGSPTIAHNAFVANTAGNGGGMSLDYCKVTVTHNVFYKNIADTNGGALMIGTAAVEIYNSAVTDNAAEAGGGIYCNNGLWVIKYCDFFRNQNGNFAGCGDASLGDKRTRNFNLDSADVYKNIYLDAGYTNPAEYDFSLTCRSRLIDAGAGIPETHPMGGSHEDIGMIEYPFRVGDLSIDGKINVADIVAMINIIFRGAPVPCPIYATDTDCDRIFTIADVIVMINYWMGRSESSCLFDLK